MWNYSLILPSFLILSIFLLFYFSRPRLPIRMNGVFLLILSSDLCTILIDYLSSRADEEYMNHSAAVLWSLNLAFFVFYILRLFFFFLFTVVVLDMHAGTRTNMVMAGAVCAVSLAITLSSPLTHAVFYIDGQGYHRGAAYEILYVCGFFYLLLAAIFLLMKGRQLQRRELFCLIGYQCILLVGNVARILFPQYLVMNTFCLMVIVVIFLGFENPDFYLSIRGDAFNLRGLRLMLDEWNLKRPYRILGFAIRNYNDERVIYGSAQMDSCIRMMDQFLQRTYPDLYRFYLRNGSFAIVGPENMDCARMSAEIEDRFCKPWKGRSAEVFLDAVFVQAGTDKRDHSVDHIINTLLVALDNAGQGPGVPDDASMENTIRSIDEEMDIKRALEKALEENQVEVFLQPLYDCREDRVVAAEALARIRDENGDLISPGLFIPIAEKNGQINELGEQIFVKVCRLIRDHKLAVCGLSWINVNLSPIQCMNKNLEKKLTYILNEFDVSAQSIHLEITEMSMVDYSLLKKQIDALSGCGFQLALDDYGSGYSNLSRVKKYPFSNIKIDMEVVWDYFNERDQLLPTLIQVFKEMNFAITAEGVETREMAEELKRIGCDYLQGYYFSKPIPSEEFLKKYAF